MTLKCFFKGHKWQIKYSTESKDLCVCEECGDKRHFTKEEKAWSNKKGRLIRK